MKSILEVLDKWAGIQPGKPLFTFLDVAGREIEQYTYSTLHDRTCGIARHLRDELGFDANDRILLAYPPGLEMMAAFYGCIRAGLIPVPVYPPSAHGFQSALYKLAHIAADCGATAVLTTAAYRESLGANIRKHSLEGRPEEAQVTQLRWIASDEIPARADGADYTPSDILFLQYTSGSTSHPKGVIVTHRNVLHNGALVSHPFPICVSWLPQYHDMGLIGYYIYPALAGGCTYGFSPFDFIQRPALWFESISKYRATATSAPNFAFDYCLRPGRIQEEAIEKADLSSLRFLMTAAEPVHPDTYARFLKTFEPFGLNPEAFYVAYGLAENTLAVSSHGRTALSVNAKALSLRRVRPTTEVSAIASAKRIVSCGQPLGDISVRIVDPDKHAALPEGQVGEIWVTGESKCSGYWNNPELTASAFRARISGDNHHGPEYLRTGDLGFLQQGELYVCGRIKDTIIIRGQNYYPQDIEQVVQEASESVRRNCVVAFEFAEETEPAIAIVAEVNPRSVPDVHELVAAVRTYLNVEVAHVSLVAPKSLPKTSSGKLMRSAARQMWLEGRYKEVARHSRDGAPAAHTTSTSPLESLKLRYNLTGKEDHTLVEAGVDSLDLVVLMHELQEILKEKGAQSLARDVDVSLIQRIKVSELYRLADYLERNPGEAVQQIQRSLSGMIEEHRRAEAQLMQADRHLAFRVAAAGHPARGHERGAVLLTGGTGFVGPFLINSLLERTHDDIHVLVRADTESEGRDRLWAAFESIGPEAARKAAAFERRVIPVCGNLARPNLGLSTARWKDLSARIGAVYHNGAGVNYLFTYEGLRAANVQGTNETLRFAFDGPPKTFNYVSTTFIFGWATKEVLHETDCNSDMELLDFGYSQSKWVAEQVVADALRQGLPGRIFRPALVSPSVAGYGTNLDIAIRLLAFMVNHGIGVDALNQVSFVPVDVVAGNIVAISQCPQSLGRTFHVTRDDYANMMDITSLITGATGQRFDLFSLPSFVPEVIKRCTRQDPLFPLLDFLIGSIHNISSMEFKRYDSSGYMRARDAAPGALQDPSLEDTVLGILRFMKRKELIAVPVPRAEVVAGLTAGNAA